MKFEQIPPPAPLKHYIRYFWTLESEGPSDTSSTFRTMADGSPGLMFQQPEKGCFYQNGKLLANTFLYGQSTRYAELCLEGTFSTIGVFFYPHALKPVFGINAEELTDTCTDLNTMAEKQGLCLTEIITAATSTAERVEVLSSFLIVQIRKNEQQQDGAMHYAMSSILQSGGSIALKDLQDKLQLSERSFERKFRQHIGITPKLFARICRFQASLRQLRNNRYNKLSDIAFENDYADQSHFIRSFKEFAGLSPFQYRQQSREVVENLSRLTF
ncbi:MAG TPA: helix-turn-helix transcriptional regulator [Chitinophaga sp.]|nr:helix-turn-helix transcriptional regulator [Chitinophaga sp.]